MKKFSSLKVALFLLLAGTASALLMFALYRSSSLNKVTLSGIDLAIPARYMKVKRFFWIELAKGLESDQSNVRVAIPYREIGCRFSGAASGDVDVVLNVLPPLQYEQASSRMRSVVKEAREEKVPVVEFDGSSLASLAGNDAWAFDGTHKLGGQVVGRCRKLQDVSRCSVVASVSPDLVLEFSIDDRDQRCIDKIVSRTSKLAVSWKAK